MGIESCFSGHGPLGFSLFFTDGPLFTCPKGDRTLLETYALDLSSLRLIVADSSNSYSARSKILSPRDCLNDTTCKETLGLTRSVAALARADDQKRTWLLVHVPIFAVDWDLKEGPNVAESSAMLLSAWRTEPATDLDAIVSGDRHLFQIVARDSGRPLQLTSGAGGVNLDGGHAADDGTGNPQQEWQFDVGGTPPDEWKGCNYRSHGYAIAKRDTGYAFRFVPLQPAYVKKGAASKEICEGFAK